MDVLGTLSFSDIPDVSTNPVLIGLNGASISQVIANITSNRPAAGIPNRLFYDTTLNIFQFDNGSAWVDVVSPVSVSGTANQIDVAGTNPFTLSLASNPILPGVEKLRLPTGTTAQRPASPVAGDIRYNSSLNLCEKYTGAYWSAFGLVIQQVTANIPASSGTGTVPYDNTTPTSTEGNQIWSQTFTPVSATSRIIIEFHISHASSSTTSVGILSVFAGTTNIGSTAQRVSPTTGQPSNMSMRLVHQPGSTATITYSARLGNSNTSTAFCNQGSGTNLGGSMVSQLTITEIE